MSEIMFTNVKDAVRWSEEVMLRSGIRSSMEMWQSSGGGHNLTGNELTNVAQTVTMITASCRPFKGMAAKAVFSPCSTKEEDRNVAIAIAANMMRMEEAQGKHYEKLITLGVCAIRSKRSAELFGCRYPMKKIAKALGITRERLYKSKNWSTLKVAAEQRLLSMVMQAEIEIYSELSNRGWIM